MAAHASWRTAAIAATAGVALWSARAWANGAFPDSSAILLSADRPDQIILATNFGLIISEDDGQTWSWTCEQAATVSGALYQVGPPPQEDYFMGHAVERIFLPVMKMQYPEIVDVAMPAEGIFHNLMIVSIKKSYAGQARKVMSGIWAMGQAMGRGSSTPCRRRAGPTRVARLRAPWRRGRGSPCAWRPSARVASRAG